MRWDKAEYLALLRRVQTERRTTRETLQEAAGYAIQIVLCAAFLLWAYNLVGAQGVMWAIVSAILVVQPGIEQSISTSAIRIAANLVGGAVGFGVGVFCGTTAGPLLAALVITVFVCEILRLDLGVRTACVATLIVMTSSVGKVSTSSFERLTAVLIGCLVAILLQIVVGTLRHMFGSNAPRPSSQEPSKQGE
ncbi:MAG TPA: FUSC family protein [Phycisphaerae bacterium]|jgi:uncharacterized membrane protein YgaE (UPF0421/DUF939 family)